MNTNILATCLGLLAASLTASTTVAAADNCAGYTVEVGDRSIIVNDNADEPGHPAIGTCKIGNGMSGTCTYPTVPPVRSCTIARLRSTQSR